MTSPTAVILRVTLPTAVILWVKVNILVSMAKMSTSCYLYQELKALGKWTPPPHPLYPVYTYYVLTVNKKESIWEKKVNGFTCYSVISTII